MADPPIPDDIADELVDELTESARSLRSHVRTGWESRSAAYRKRLEGAGRSGKLNGRRMTPAQTREWWERGGDLRGGRGHAPKPKGAAPKDATDREAVGMGDEKTYAELQRWRRRPPSRGGPPAWIPRSEEQMGTDVAAVLSQIDIPPSRWKSVEFRFLPGGGAVMVVTPKHGYPRVVVLPDAQAVSEVGRLLRSPESMSTNETERKRLERAWRRRGAEIEVQTSGYRRRTSMA